VAKKTRASDFTADIRPYLTIVFLQVTAEGGA